MAQNPSTQTTFSTPIAAGSSSGVVSVPVYIQTAGSDIQILTKTGGRAEPAVQEFLASGLTCPTGSSVSAGQTCQISLTFSPLYPGLRQGAVLVESGGVVLGSALVSGVGQGSLPVLKPGDISTAAGDGELTFGGDGVKAVNAPIFLPTGLVVDAAGNLFFCDSRNNRVRRVDGVTGFISTVAGGANAGSSGDGGPATDAELNGPSGLAMDGAGNLYISDGGNQVIRRVDAVSQVISRLAGQIGVASFSGDGGPALNATLSGPVGLAMTPGGDLLIADSGNNRIRSVDLVTDQIQTIAGSASGGFSGDGGPALSAELFTPFGVAVRFDGAIAIADKANQVVRLIDPFGMISTVAGINGNRSYSGDSGPATQAKLDNPAAVAFDPAGDLFIADSENNRVRGVFGSAGVITTVVGNGTTNSADGTVGDGGPSDQASLYTPYALVFDSAGNLWVSDLLHNRIRKVNGSLLSHTFSVMKVGNISAPFDGTLYNAGNIPLLLQMPSATAGLVQSALDPNTTTCSASPIAPMAFCVMGVEFAPTQVSSDETGSVTWLSNALNIRPVDALDAQVLSVEPTAVAIHSAQNPGVLGRSVTLTGSVSLTSTGATGSGLTGNVSFAEGSTSLCSPAPLNGSGNASCVVPSLSLGTHVIVATYSGDANDAGAVSAPFTEIIKQQPALALAVSTSPASVTTEVILTLTAADQSGTPTGAVMFYDGGTALATVNLNGAGIAQWSTQNFSVGMHSLSAQYVGDAANGAGTSNSVAEQITQLSTVTVLASNSSNPMIDTALVLVARVASNIGSLPTGTVQFSDGSGGAGAVIGSASLDASGTATLSVSSLQPGLHSIVAIYQGDVNDAGSSSAALAETVQATGLTVGSNLNPGVHGQGIILTAQLDGTGAVPPSGVAVFHDGGALLAAGAFNSAGTASIATSNLSVGTHVITVSYAGDGHYATAGGQLTQVVVMATTTTQITAGANPVIYGQPLVLTATVTSNGGPATGTINFLIGTAVIGSAPLNADGLAVLPVLTLSPGTDVLTASYAGDGNANASVSTPVAIVVKQATSLVVSSGSNPALTLSAITLTASLSNAGAAPATGLVSFTDGGVALGTASIDSSGHASLTLPKLLVGTHIIAASYAGDTADFSSNSAIYNLVVQLRATQTSLSGSATDSANPQQITLIAVVRGDGSSPPSGDVVFSGGDVTLGQAAVDSTGVATITVIFSQLTQQVVASYGGDISYAASASNSTAITAGSPAQFTITTNAQNVTLVSHQHTTLQINLGSVKGFTDTISLGCLGLPFAATCTFTPSQLKLAADGSSTASLILDTGDPLGAGSGTNTASLGGRTTLLWWLPLGMILGLLRHKERNATRKKIGTLLMFALAFGLTMDMTGCSGLTTSGTPPGTYQFKVIGTGQGSGTTQVQNVTLVVTQ